MKKLLLSIIAIALLTACGNKTQSTDSTESADSTAIAEEAKPQVPLLTTDSISMSKSDEKADVSVIVDWPTEGDEALIAAVREYICKTLSVKMNTDGKAVVKKAFQKSYTETAGMWEENNSSDDEGEAEDDEEESVKGPSYMYSISIQKIADNDKFVTYLTNDETYYGGAHGSSSSGGVTFSKATTKTVGYKMEYNDKTMSYSVRNQTLFNDKIKTKEFNELLKAGLKEYFQDVTDEGKNGMTDDELKDMLMDEQVNKLPLPGASPHFTDKGLEFIYQQYEIAAYCYGMPTFVIPFNKIKPYLSEAALELIPEK